MAECLIAELSSARSVAGQPPMKAGKSMSRLICTLWSSFVKVDMPYLQCHCNKMP
jgi:hypothetical protein